jgi:hypothetical protein
VLLGLSTLALILWLPATARAGDEDAFLSFWADHQPVVSNHPAAIAVCTRFLAGHPASAYRPAVASLGAWHALAAGRTNEARAGFTALLGNGAAPVEGAAAESARRWLTRLDREDLRSALTAWYAGHVAYPRSLEPLATLPPAVRPPLRDRWNEPWDYRLEAFRRLRGLGDQRYRLESRTLGAASSLAAALAVPFASRLHAKLIRMVTDASAPSVELEFPAAAGRRAVLMEGTACAGIRLTRVGPRALLLSDGDHWQVLPRAAGKVP